jgi:hypothetical protein
MADIQQSSQKILLCKETSDGRLQLVVDGVGKDFGILRLYDDSMSLGDDRPLYENEAFIGHDVYFTKDEPIESKLVVVHDIRTGVYRARKLVTRKGSRYFVADNQHYKPIKFNPRHHLTYRVVQVTERIRVNVRPGERVESPVNAGLWSLWGYCVSNEQRLLSTGRGFASEKISA